MPDEPEVPDALAHVWNWWHQLNARRLPGFDGPAPLSFSEIGFWIALTRTQITPEEVLLLVSMDNTYLRVVTEEMNARRERERT